MLPPQVRVIIKQITEAIEKSTEKADSGANDRSKSANEAQKHVAASVDGLANAFESYQAKQAESERKKNRRENLTIASLVVTAAVTIALAWIAFLQWGTLEKTDRTLRDTLDTNKLFQRAYIFTAMTEIRLSPDALHPTAINFAFSLINNGSTATKNLRFHYGCMPSKEDLKEPWVLWGDTREEVINRAVIGPKGSSPVGCSFPIDQLIEMTTKKLFGFILIDISYEDGINPGIIRKTQQALNIRDISYIPTHAEGGLQAGAKVEVIWGNRGVHNCADEECPD